METKLLCLCREKEQECGFVCFSSFFVSKNAGQLTTKYNQQIGSVISIQDAVGFSLKCCNSSAPAGFGVPRWKELFNVFHAGCDISAFRCRSGGSVWASQEGFGNFKHTRPAPPMPRQMRVTWLGVTSLSSTACITAAGSAWATKALRCSASLKQGLLWGGVGTLKDECLDITTHMLHFVCKLSLPVPFCSWAWKLQGRSTGIMFMNIRADSWSPLLHLCSTG